MNIQVNGRQQALPEAATLHDLITTLGLQDKRIAVELNAQITPRSQHASTALREGDQVEIVHAIGGG